MATFCWTCEKRIRPERAQWFHQLQFCSKKCAKTYVGEEAFKRYDAQTKADYDERLNQRQFGQ